MREPCSLSTIRGPVEIALTEMDAFNKLLPVLLRMPKTCFSEFGSVAAPRGPSPLDFAGTTPWLLLLLKQRSIRVSTTTY